jgi:hypothetical protein
MMNSSGQPPLLCLILTDGLNKSEKSKFGKKKSQNFKSKLVLTVTREVYKEYLHVKNREKFFEEHRAEIILHKAAKKYFDEHGYGKDKKLPKIDSRTGMGNTPKPQENSVFRVSRIKRTAHTAPHGKRQRRVLAWRQPKHAGAHHRPQPYFSRKITSSKGIGRRASGLK